MLMANEAAKVTKNVSAKKSPSPVDKLIGSRVRMARLLKGMSQEALGDALGLTFQQVQKYEKGTNRIGGSRMQQISNAVAQPVSFFFEGAQPISTKGEVRSSDDEENEKLVTRLLCTTGGIKLTKAYTAMTDNEHRRLLVDLAVAMLSKERRKS